MARDTRDILFRFISDTKSLQSGTRDANKSLGSTDRAIRDTKRAIGALGVALGGRELLQFATDAAQMADQSKIAGESASKVLGPALAGLRDNLDDTRGAMGLNTLELDTTIAKLGLLTEGYGLTDDAQAEMIEGLVDMSGDLAAFRGDAGLTTEAIDAITAAIRGEFDPLESWGVKLKETDIAERTQEILDMNLGISEGEARMQAISDLIAERAAPAMGALAENMDTLGAKTAISESKMEDLQIQIGEYLLPIAEAGAEKFIEFADGITALTDAGTTLGEKLGGIGDIWDSLAGEMLVSIDEIKEEFQIWKRRVEDMARPFSNIRQWIGDIKRAISGGFKNPFSSWKAPSLPSWVPRFHDGGVVPGPRGAEVPIIAQAGETIIPAGHRMGSSGGSVGTTINISVQGGLGSPTDIARSIVDALQTYNRNAGPIPIVTRGPGEI